MVCLMKTDFEIKPPDRAHIPILKFNTNTAVYVKVQTFCQAGVNFKIDHKFTATGILFVKQQEHSYQNNNKIINT